ncbi:hypothetical protein F4820DRAFT_447488 [Hypoxylon rubiginosum]|uniref:Uncharacterized protein n=1 Tax=Hypoxylon rubiginosum TaxID=110542 RepID=A0ACB9Z3A2_9PEZI|nr:hypothetical protein F4820DRAFT_447488 [Hypoxylon rubiginosum]
MEPEADLRGLSILNASPRHVPGPHLLHELVAPSSRSNLPAIDYYSRTSKSTSISYTELHCLAHALAVRMSKVLSSLASVDVQEQLVIPILIPQSPALYIGLLAILKLGAAFCPLNLGTPKDRLDFILRDVGAKLILVNSETLSELPADDGPYKVMLIDQQVDDLTSGAVQSLPFKVLKDADLAYVMYTSGSTGTPKGVGISHLAATQSLLAHDRHIPAFTRFLQFAAPTFDVSVFEIFFPLFRGSTLVCCSRAEMLTDLPGVLRDMRVDACELTPSVAGSLLKRRSNVPGLRLLLTIGEMLTDPVIQEFGGDESEGSLLWAMYGPTEATIHCTLQPAFSKRSSKNNIGVPLDTVSALIVDTNASEFRVLPLGHTGELAVGGNQISTGYINRLEQTSAAFVDTRWGRVYRTGDRARMLHDGKIECLGRVSSGQVKLNGQRIELGEIEHALLRTPGCHGAFAAVISNVLVAFAAVEEGLEAAGIQEAILTKCKSWLPAFMVPAEIRTMHNFPRLPSGKVDNKTLIKQYETAAISDSQDVGNLFEDDLERQLCEIAGAILGQRVFPPTRLSSLGLDSLAAIEYASSVRAIGIPIYPVDILDVSTVRELFRVIESRHDATCPSTSIELSPDHRQVEQLKALLESDSEMQPHLDDVDHIEICSPLQEAMIAETFKDARLYINQAELNVPSHFTTESIKSWFLTLAQRNEILRTGFMHLGHKLYQVIWRRLGEDQIEVLDHARRAECIDVEIFLRRPLKIDIIVSEPPAEHHTVILTLHHSVYDGWTLDLLIEDLSLIARGEPPVDRPQFRQVSRQLAAESRNGMMDANEFWAEKLCGSVPVPLPNFRTVAIPNPRIMTTSKKVKVDPTLVQDFARGAFIGPQVVFQACLAWVWGALNGVDDPIIGSVSSGRTLPIPGIEKIMGPCMATLPLRTVLSRYETIIELLQATHSFNRETLRHGTLPLAEIKRAAGVPPAQTLFDVIFAYQETLSSRRQESNIIHAAWHKDTVEAKLLLEIAPCKDHFSCQITWHSDVFSEPLVDTLFGHLDHLVGYFVQSSDQPLSKISRSFPAERLSHHNRNPRHLQMLPSLSELVEKSAMAFPANNALCFASSISEYGVKTHLLTYRELNSRANRIARYLKGSSAVTRGVIALVMEKSELLYCTILGILKADCAYLPILPSTPLQRLQLILQQAQPQLCLIDGSCSQQLVREAPCSVIDLTSIALSEYADSNLGIPQDPSDVAYIIYTSGTTGIPKGVSVTNSNVLSNIEALSHIYPHEPSDRMLQACSQAFDMSVFEMFFSWRNGMCITHLGVTVTVASLLEPSRVPCVKFLVTAGEPMTEKVLEQWSEQLWQGYGPSETTNICTVRKVSHGDSPQYLGWSFENTSAFILSPGSEELVPLGCTGEMCFGGDQVAAGYLRMPELTAAKFIEHQEYGRLYRSGDVGRMLPDGSLIILGRLDTQVKLRGIRIELQEIHATVLRNGLAKTCTSVLITPKNTSAQQLALFYVPKDHELSGFKILPVTDSMGETIIAMQQTLRAALPDYMVPSFIVPISALPLTSSGKVDHDLIRQSMTDISDKILSLCSSAQNPDEDSLEWTKTEIMISEAISKTLGVDSKVISRWGSFAALGIDSISAMPLARQLQTVFRIRIPLSLVISNPSVGRLASAIVELASSATTQARAKGTLLPKGLVAAVRERFAIQSGKNVENVLPCTPLQEAMLSSSPSPKAGSSYCNQMLFRLRLPSRILAEHWNMMFERHGILRTCFVTTEDKQYPMAQVVLKSHLPTWETFEVDSSSFHEHVLKHRYSLPSAVDSGKPPVSLALILLDNSTEYLSFICHHAIYDGVSVRIILAEIEALSRHQRLSAPPSFELFLEETLPLPPGADDFWARHFHAFSPLRFDKLKSDKDIDSDMVSEKASSRSLSSISAQLRDLGISLLPLCQAAWAITLSLLQESSDICFGNVVSGRSIALDHIDALVAPCFNTIPIRIDLSRISSLQEIAKKFRQLNTEIIPYQFTSLRRIQSRLPISRLFDTVFILQPPSTTLDRDIWSLEQEHGAMDVPLVCEITPIQEQDIVTLRLYRDPSIFPRQTTTLILDIFWHVFYDCLDRPSSHIPSTSKLPIRWQPQITQLSTSRELPLRDMISATPGPSPNENWTEIEMKVRSVLSSLAKIPEAKIKRNTPIYRYGLDSIGAVQLASLLRRNSYGVSAIDVIENPTCAGIASRLATRDINEEQFVYDFDSFQDTVSRHLHSMSSVRNDYEALLPCTPTQQGMISQFLTSKGARYFNYASWVLAPEVRPQQIVEAWSHLTARHQILRSGFIPVNHQDTSYAMIVYLKEGFLVPVSIRQPGSFNCSRWRIEAASSALEALSVPPWQVLVVDGGEGQATMHLAMHHALYDANSLRILLNELTGALSNVPDGNPVSIGPVLSAYLDPAHSQPASEAFWREKAEDLVVNKFPIMTPLHIGGHAGSIASETCSTSPENFRHRAAEAGITVRAALQAAWTRVLSAYLGEVSVTFGAVLDGRNSKEEQDVVFPLVTTLPILARNSDSNAELLEYMMEYNTNLRRHERTPLSKIQRWLGRPDGQLFDTIIAYQTMHMVGKSKTPWEVLDETASVEYALALEVVETTSNQLQLNLTYDADILPDRQAHILMRQFDATLLSLLASPQGYASQLASLKPDLFSILPATYQEIPSPVGLLHQFVEQSAQKIPTAIALEFVEELGDPIRRRHWTYHDLNEMGNRVAQMLSTHKTPPGSIIAACFNKCPEAYFSILGILKAGCAFLSLDPSAPASRLEFILSDSTAACLLIETELNKNLSLNTTIPTYSISERELSYIPTIYQTPSQISPSDTCYCLYTSGTTGAPKGCLISHDNAVQAMLAFKQLFAGHWDARSRWLQFASFHFDVSVLEQYWSWFVGITVVAAPKDLILSDITTTISTLNITHIDLTPSLARLIHPDEVPSLCRGVFITGGEQLRQEILKVWGPKKVIYNAYGPTEATIGVTMFQRVPANGRSSNIGSQFPNVGSFVLEPGTEVPVLRGGVGELCVSGRLVGQGYLNRKDLTNERFPILRQYGERVYRTGDLVRVLHDGSFDFLGRADDQVKLRGQRLEIGEINHAIKDGLSNQLADVATFITRHLGQDSDHLVSFFAPVANRSLPTDLHICSDQPSLDMSRTALESCRDRLPGYMVPTYILCVPFIPLSPNNKADTKRLKQLFAELPREHLQKLAAGSGRVIRALSEKEQQIAIAISTVTQVKGTEIHPSSSIFELGIDSINVARLAVILRSQGLTLASPSLILRHPQMSRLSEAIQQGNATSLDTRALQANQSIRAHYHRYIGMACRLLEIDKADVEYIAPCTPLQEGMISRSKVTGSHSAYFNQFRLDLDARVSIGRLKKSWENIFAECAVLRTAFLATTNGHIQIAIKRRAMPWVEIDTEGIEIDRFSSGRRERWIASNQDILQHPFEIDHFEHHGRRVLLLRLFHAVYDGHSFELLLRRVNAEYHYESPIHSPPFIEVLPHGPLLKYSESRPFWEDIFRGYIFQPIPALDTDVNAAAVLVSRSLHVNDLEARRIALRVTHQTVLQAAWLVTLRKLFGFVPAIGVVFSGRSSAIEGVENVIGPLFNTLPFRVELDDHKTWASLVERVQYYNTSVLDYVHTPLRDIQKWCSAGQPLFDALMTFDREDVFPTVGARPFWSSVHSDGSLDYPLALEIILSRDRSLRVNIVAQGNIATEASINILLDKFYQALAALASSDRDTLHSDVPVEVGGSATMANGASVAVSPPSNIKRTGESGFFQISRALEVRHEVASLARIPDKDISETTSLFELGLDSIDVITLVTRLKRLGLHVTVSELMKTPTVKGIVFLHDSRTTSDIQSGNGIDALKASVAFLKDCLIQDGKAIQNVSSILPPTPLQDAMVADMLLSSFHRYFNHDVLAITPNTDLDRLRSAWTTVYANSPILRTTFAEIDNPGSKTAFCQMIRDEPLRFNSTMEITSLSEIAIIIDQARARAATANAASDLFQLTFVTTPKDRYLVISISHALYDGWSLELLHRDVQAAYDGHYHARDGYESYLSHLLTASPTEAGSFWADYLNDARPTILRPVTEPRGDHRAVLYRSELVSTTEVGRLKATCQRYRITPQVLAQGCWAPVLATISKSLDVVFGVVLSGRDTDEAQGLLFPTMNTIPLRVVLHGTIEEYFNYLQTTMSDVMGFQHLPLREVQKLAKFDGDKLFNTLFLLQNVKDRQSATRNLILKSVHSSSAVEYPLCVEMEIMESSVVWRIAGDQDYVSLQDAKQILHDIESVLQYFCNNPAAVLEFDNSSRVSVCGLKPFDLSSTEDAAEIAPPTNSISQEIDLKLTESPIMDVLSELSGIDRCAINPDQSIYQLGLDSISAIKASSILRKRGVDVSVRDLIKAASIREILSRPKGRANQSQDHPVSAPSRLGSVLSNFEMRSLFKSAEIDETEVEAVLPALPIQVHMLSAWQNTGGLLFFPHFTYKLSGSLSHETVSRAWSRLVAEIPVLRTRFIGTKDLEIPFIQIIMKPKPTDPTEDNPEEIKQGEWTYEETATPFAFIRIHTSHLGEAYMHLHIHHALYDGVSLPAITDRFLELCDNCPTTSLATNPTIWHDFVSNHYSPEVRQERQKFWVSYLRGANPIHLLAHQEPMVNGQKAQQRKELKRGALTDVSNLRAMISAHGATLQALFFAAYSRALAASQQADASSKGDADIVFGVYLANRASFSGLEEAPFPTLSIVPLIVKDPLTRSVADVAVEIQKDLVEISSFENASAGLWEIYDWTGIQIEACVNFLTTPGKIGNRTAVATSRSIAMTDITRESIPTPEDIAQPSIDIASRDEVRRAFMHTVDVEAAVYGDALDIGIFCPPSFSDSQAKGLIRDIINTLEAVR